MLLKSGGRRLILRSFDKGQIVLQDLDNQDCRAVTEGALLQAIFEEKVTCLPTGQPDATMPTQLTREQERGATAKAIKHGADLLQWVMALRQRGIKQISDTPWVNAEIRALRKNELAHLPAFERTTLYEAELKLRKAGGDASVLVPDYAARGGRGKERIDVRAQTILKEELKIRLDVPILRPFSIIEFYQKVCDRIATHNASTTEPIEIISESTVRRFIHREVPAYDRFEMRYGSKKTLKAFRRNSGSRDRAARPLELGEYDDIDCGVFLVDDRNGLPYGRAFLTDGVDQHTLTVLGYDLGTRPRSYHSAIGAICDSLLPKTDCLPGEMGYGIQGVMLVDNASYNTGKAMKARREIDHLLFARARPYGSTEKSVIEHYNHHVKADFCCSLPGWRGAKNDREAIKRGTTSAILTVQEFARMYRHWVTKIYANTPGEDGMTPKERWLKFYHRHAPAVRYTPQQLQLLRLRPGTLKFRASSGLERLDLRYDCEELMELRDHLGPKASVDVYLPDSLTYIKVRNPLTNELMHVPCTEDHTYVQTTTFEQHRMILALQRSRRIKNPGIKELVEGRDILRQIVQEASQSHKLRTRRWAVNVGVTPDAGSDAEGVDKQPKTVEVEAVCTELEYELSQLETVTVDNGEDWS
jgi:putative transposase